MSQIIKRSEDGKRNKNADKKLVRYQGRKYYIPGERVNSFLIVSCFYVQDIKSTMNNYHTKKIILISLHKVQQQKKKWLIASFTNSVKNTIVCMIILREKKKYPIKTAEKLKALEREKRIFSYKNLFRSMQITRNFYC